MFFHPSTALLPEDSSILTETNPEGSKVSSFGILSILLSTKSTQIGSAVVLPNSLLPRLFGLSNPTQTLTKIESLNPVNQVLSALLVVPVFPAKSSLLSSFIFFAVPLFAASCNIFLIIVVILKIYNFHFLHSENVERSF